MMSVEAARPRKAPVVAGHFELERDLALGVLAGGDAPDRELLEVRGDPGHALDRLEDRVDRAVADRGVLDELAVGGGCRPSRWGGCRSRRSCAG